MKLLLLLTFLSSFLIITATHICNGNNTTMQLQIGEIAFYETPKFPSLLPINDFFDCCLMFSLNLSAEEENYKLFVVFSELGYGPEELIVYYTIFNILDASAYKVDSYFNADNIAQQGFVIFEAWENRCPLESISREKPFKLESESQILHLRSSYANIDHTDEYSNRTTPCQWRFIAPEGYGFKVVVQIFNVSQTTKFSIINSTEILANERSVKLLHPYYNSDSYIQIDLSLGDSNFVTQMEFQAYVTIVKKQTTIKDGNCITTKTDDGILWTNFVSPIHGYDNSNYCSYNFTIPKNTGLLVEIDQMQLEKSVDYIKYSISGNTELVDYKSDDFMIQPKNVDRFAEFEFISDGSVQALGFSLIFIMQTCDCDYSIILCDNQEYDLTKNSLFYCGNMNCSFTFKLQPCNTPVSLLNILYEDGIIFSDLINVYSNEETVLKVNSNNPQAEYNVHLNSANQNVLNIITSPISVKGYLIFRLRSYNETYQIKRISVTSETKNVIIDLDIHEFNVIESINKLQALEFIIYSNAENGVSLFSNESLTTSLYSKDCFCALAPYKCVIKASEFAVYSPESLSRFIVVQTPEKPIGCVFNKTVFLTKNNAFLYITGIATADSTCLLTLLVEDDAYFRYYYISKTWTNSKTENVKIFIGNDQQKLYFEFNSTTATQWKDIGLFSNVYSIIIPRGAAILINLKRTPRGANAVLQIPEFFYKSVTATPYYGTSKRSFNSILDFITYQIGNYHVKFTATDYSVANKDDFYFYVDNTKISINKTGEHVTFKNQNVTLFYSTKNGINDGALFLIELL